MKGQAISQVKAHNHLRFKVTSTLSWSEHISCMRRKCAQRVGMIRKIRHLLPNQVLKRIYAAQVRSVMECGCTVLSRCNISVLQKPQDRFCGENQVKLPTIQARLNVYGQAAVTYRFPSDHRSQAPSSGVSTWMGDHPDTPCCRQHLVH